MSGNALYAYDLTTEGNVLPGRKLASLMPDAKASDCRALAVAPDGVVWAGIAATPQAGDQLLHVVSYKPGARVCVDHGPIGVKNPEFTTFTGPDGKDLPHHHGFFRKDGTLAPRYVVMGISGTSDGTVYVTTLYPYTLHEIKGLKP